MPEGRLTLISQSMQLVVDEFNLPSFMMVVEGDLVEDVDVGLPIATR